jgi:hypothetical protein
MLPYKHYAASEIEQVLNKHENPSEPSHECGAEESTIRRWIRDFPEILSALAAHLETLANISQINNIPPLQRVYTALASLASPPPDCSRLAWAYYWRNPTLFAFY